MGCGTSNSDPGEVALMVRSSRREGPGRRCSVSLLTECASYALCPPASPFSFFLKQLEPRALPAVSQQAGRAGEEVKHLGSARAGWPGSGRAAAPHPPSPGSFIL